MDGSFYTSAADYIASIERAIYCCAAHAVAGLQAISRDRKELPAEIPARWRYT